MRRLVTATGKGIGALVGVTGAFLFAAWATSHRPGKLEYPSVVKLTPGRPLRRGEVFTLVSWNIQYSASRKPHFFYDGGRIVHVPRQDVLETIAAINSALLEIKADITLIQEIDRSSRRTQHIDQLTHFVEALTPASWVSTPYHKAPYVPFPLHDMMGPVDTHLGILSQFDIQSATRIAMAMMNEAFYRQWFNLKRCILAADIPIEGGGVLRIANTHLSAFSYGDGTLTKQVNTIKEWMEKDQSFILAGDFNLLPPGDDPKRLSKEADHYADAINPIETLIPRFRSVIAPEQMLDEKWHTYLPYGHAEPDRMIDYAFMGDQVEVVDVEVPRKYSAISDHLPLVVRFRLV